MKKFIFILPAVILSQSLLFSFVPCQDVFQNLKNPLNPDAGRILRLERTLTLTDKGEDFFFTAPRDLKVDQRGNIYISFNEQLLKFSPDGTFIKNIITQGQGPGEVQGQFYYELYDNRIYLYIPLSRKTICLTLSGKFIDEIRFSEQFNGFIGLYDDNYLFLKSAWPPIEERTGKMMDIEKRILYVTPQGIVIKKSPNFPTMAYLGPKFSTWWIFLKEALDKEKNILYISHTSEYLIEALDIKSNKIIKRFNRKYKRVKHRESKKRKETRKKRNLPKQKFENDIAELFFNQEHRRLWVKTSCQSEEKGVLFDIFDEKGRYVDNFYLNLNGDLLAVKGDSVFFEETDESGIVSIAKYRILK